MKIRKQVYELTTDDLARSRVWKFALDEEGTEGQDEATVRPWKEKKPLDPAHGIFIVRAKFVLADNTSHLGYLTPGVQGDVGIATVQPVIVTDAGQIGFWHGVLIPTENFRRESYQKLGRKASQVFPIRYSADVTIGNGSFAGSIPGFMHYRSFADQTVVIVK